MGCGIAEVAAHSGCDVVLREVNEALVEASKRKLEASLDTGVRKGKLTEKERDDVKHRIRFTDKLEELSGCDLVVEAVVEDLDDKTEIFAALGKIVRPDTLITSNTSSIPIMQLAAATPAREDHHHGQGPCWFRRQRAADPVPVGGDPHGRCGSGERRGHRQGDGRGL